MLPTRRDLHFRLGPDDARNWHAAGPALTHFINAMSLTFPEGERYFIHTVRHYRDRVTDPELKKALTAFIGQEAMHSREHEDYNRLLAEAGLPVEDLQESLVAFFDRLRKHLPPAAQLSVTIAQEHLTAIVAELVLTDPRLLEGAGGRLAALWRWHALEEIEHKAVAFDVYEAALGRGVGPYALRAGGLVATTIGFLAMVLWGQSKLLAADERHGGRPELARFARFMFASPGLLPRLVQPWLQWFRPGFHPWQHDNRHLLDQVPALVASL
jgi:predicted metal-dependent hydrolase